MSKDNTINQTDEDSKKTKKSENQKSENQKTEIVKADEKSKKITKTKKPVKTKKIKVPSLFKKKYTQKSLDKKIYKKIFIADDKKFLQNYIKQVGTKTKKNEEIPLYSIPRDIEITKKDQKQLVTIAKSIKKQKSGFKFGPLIAVVAFILAVGITVTLTKNLVCRKIITSTCESIFEAKCDIGYLNLKFLDSSFTMKNFEVANKKEPMKDLFSIEDLNLDFDFPQLLKAHFVIEDISVLGVETGKERTTSGDISAKKLAKIQKKKAKKAAKEAKKTENTGFMVALKDKVVNLTTTEISSLFEQYNPQTIIENCYAQLETPKMSEDVKNQIAKINEEWKKTPETLTTKIDSVKTSVNAAANYDFSSIQNNPTKIKEALETINNAITEVNSLKDETSKVANNFKTQANEVSDLSKKLTDAITHDKNLAQDEISKITSFKLSDVKNIISGYFDKLGYSLLGKYYPYVYKAVNKLLEIKNSSSSSTKKTKTKKEKTKVVAGTRQSGRNVYFVGDTTPRFWLKNLSASGFGISANAINVSSDQDALGKPAEANFTLSKNNIAHNAKLVVDTRSSSSAPLINADYNCSSFPINLPSSLFAGGQGVPTFDATSKFSANAKIYDAEGFTISGDGDFTNLKITAEAFEPEYAYNIYAGVLSKITSMTLGVTAGYKSSDGLIMNISTDADKKFANALVAEMQTQLASVKKSVEEQLSAKITELTGGALGEVSSFDDIKAKITNAQSSVDELSKQLEAKKQEATNLLTSKVDEAKNQATQKATEATNQATEKAKEAASSKLKGLLGR